MRTLNRPMFNMGGPIKQGVMHGIREPHKHGGAAAGLVGDQRYPKTGGREHHAAPLVLAAPAAWTAARAAAMRLAPRALRGIKSLKNWFGKTTPASVTRGGKPVAEAVGSYTPVTTTASKFTPNWLGRDPTVRLVGGIGKSILNPTVGGWLGKGARFAASPTVIGGVAWYLWPDGTQRKTPPPTGIMKPGGYPKDKTGTGAGTGTDNAAAFAKSQRDARVQKYMDMMGYDRSKKTAIADALIDASKIVSDRGTLDRKNITAELINPIIQATSKRLDKPDQIREAVGLMATKAEIEKDLSKERDALKTTLTKLQIKGAENTLKESESFEGALGKFLSDRKGAVDKATLERISRLFADAHGETFTKIEEGTVPSGDGLYMIDSGIYRVTDGNAKQIA